MNDIMMQEWESGLVLVTEIHDELGKLFNGRRSGAVVFCLLACAAQTIDMYDERVKDDIIESAHDFIDFCLSEEVEE